MDTRAKDKKHKLKDIVLGELPSERINEALNTELENGKLVLRRSAQAHAEKRHPEQYAAMLPCLAGVLANALYVGDDLKNEGKIELVGLAPALGEFILIAVVVEVGSDGHYSVASFYCISKAKIQRRKERGFLMLMS